MKLSTCNTKNVDFYIIKGIVEEVLDYLANEYSDRLGQKFFPERLFKDKTWVSKIINKLKNMSMSDIDSFGADIQQVMSETSTNLLNKANNIQEYKQKIFLSPNY